MWNTLFMLALGSLNAMDANQNKSDIGNETSPILTCYYRYESEGGLTPDKLDPYFCTHILLAFASLSNGGYEPSDPPGRAGLLALRERNPNLKLMMSIGSSLASLITSDENRTKLAITTIQYIRQLDFDGIDYDWEFPNWGGGSSRERPNFALYLKTLREEIEKEAKENPQKSKLLLSVATAAPKTIVNAAYDIPSMAESLDFVNLMCYDFHLYKPYFGLTGPNAPLFPLKLEAGFFRTLNTAWAAQYWNKKGMPKSKIVVGIPFYGQTWRLANERVHGMYALATGIGMYGGNVNYPQMCKLAKEGGHVVFDKESLTPYWYRGKDWVSFDDAISVHAKAAWIKSEGYGGAMVFSLNCDDWRGDCGKGPFPLQNVVSTIILKT